MKPSSPPEPLFIFNDPNLGYSIQIVPLAPADRAKIKRQARRAARVVTRLLPGGDHRLNGVGRVRMKRSLKLIALTAFVIGAVWFIYVGARRVQTSPSTANKNWTVGESLTNPAFALYMVKDCIQHSLRDPDSLVIESAGKFLYLKYEGKYWWV